MPKLPPLSPTDVARVLFRNGLTVTRRATHGTLHFHPDDRTRRALVPRTNPVPRGILRTIMQTSRKPREHFTRG